MGGPLGAEGDACGDSTERPRDSLFVADLGQHLHRGTSLEVELRPIRPSLTLGDDGLV